MRHLFLSEDQQNKHYSKGITVFFLKLQAICQGIFDTEGGV